MKALAPVLAALLVACGGGDGSPGASTGAHDVTANSGTPASTQLISLCGHEVGPHLIEGNVSKVHDGDTITVNGESIRLDSIDAPELAQSYGAQAQVSLSRLVMGQVVKVAFSKTDPYGRIVGAVFTNSCQYVNLEQVVAGAAWFYRAYQCEISAASRLQFDRAESAARSARLGLWAEPAPIAPWFFRNASNPAIPVCP